MVVFKNWGSENGEFLCNEDKVSVSKYENSSGDRWQRR